LSGKPGLGIEVDPEKLKKLTVTSCTVGGVLA